MRVFLLTWGSRGDVQPFLALAHGFRQAGHEVRLGTPPVQELSTLAADVGIPILPLGPAGDDAYMRREMDRILRLTDPVQQGRAILQRFAIPVLIPTFRQGLEHARWADVIVSHFFQPAGRMLAETVGRPWISCALGDMFAATRYAPLPGVPNAGPLGNRLVWRLMLSYINHSWSGLINDARAEVGLPPLRDLAGRDFFSDGLNLIGSSPYVTPPRPDWPAATRVTGYWHLPRPEWTPPGSLADFVNTKPRPIAIGFGSMATTDGRSVTRVILDAVERLGARAVLQSGWANLGHDALPASIYGLGEAPHDWLFPRMAAIVHHGGAGTTSAALRAGVPQVFVPHIADQKIWAARAGQLGVAPKAVPRPRLTAERLAAAVRAAREPARVRRAAALGAAIRAEDGVTTAVKLVEAYVRTGRTPPATIRVDGGATDRSASAPAPASPGART